MASRGQQKKIQFRLKERENCAVCVLFSESERIPCVICLNWIVCENAGRTRNSYSRLGQKMRLGTWQLRPQTCIEMSTAHQIFQRQTRAQTKVEDFIAFICHRTFLLLIHCHRNFSRKTITFKCVRRWMAECVRFHRSTDHNAFPFRAQKRLLGQQLQPVNEPKTS